MLVLTLILNLFLFYGDYHDNTTVYNNNSTQENIKGQNDGIMFSFFYFFFGFTNIIYRLHQEPLARYIGNATTTTVTKDIATSSPPPTSVTMTAAAARA